MDQDKMIMGEPPDLEAKSRKWLFILFISILFLALVVYFYFLMLQRKSDSQIGLIALPNTDGMESDSKINKDRELNNFNNDNFAKKNHLSKSNPAINQEKLDVPSKSGLTPSKSGKETKSFSKLLPNSPASVDNSDLLPKQTSDFPAILGFEYKSAEITPPAESLIREIATRLHGKKGRLILEGHTCSLGSEEANTNLSEKRVKEVADLFREMGLGMNIRMYKVFYGESRPGSTNETPEGRTLNRRVTIRFVPDE